MTKTYTCSICLAINSAHRIRCYACGTVPKQYSGFGHPVSGSAENSWKETVIAKGADRIEKHRDVRVNLRTVPLTTYAEV